MLTRTKPITRARLATLAAIGFMAASAPAAAQIFAPGMPMPGASPPPQQQAPPCYNDFMPLRTEAEKRGAAIKAAAERKASREQICALFKRFAEAEAKVVKFVTEKQSVCGIPPQAAVQMKANHDRTRQTRDQICAGGPAGAPPGAIKPSGPGLSEALGTVRTPGVGPGSAPSGTFDTLSGNVLGR